MGATDCEKNDYFHTASHVKGEIDDVQILVSVFECNPTCIHAQGATPLHLAYKLEEKEV